MMRACTLILATVLHLAHSQTFPSPPPAPLPLAPGPAAILYNLSVAVAATPVEAPPITVYLGGSSDVTIESSQGLGSPTPAPTPASALPAADAGTSRAGRKMQSDTDDCPFAYYDLADSYQTSDNLQSYGLCPGNDRRGQFTQDVAQKAWGAYGKNVMVFDQWDQKYTWDAPGNEPNGLVFACEVACLDVFSNPIIPIQYKVWVFDGPTTFHNHGDGGFINWCFISNSFDRDDKTVTFH